MSLAHDENVIEGLTPDATDNSPAMGTPPRRSQRALEDLHLVGCEDRVEGLAVHVIAVAQQEAQ
ncbi:hypothetical protein [Streptomyces incanus]|uniref:Uncharacterized protein n=1 Tax=Streptomyces incanus TaxID=887453 RepID=A0ABW0Y0I0_9ACTN